MNNDEATEKTFFGPRVLKAFTDEILIGHKNR